MDAKPQRPVRARTFRDENQAPAALPMKSIHSRNKSSPALSTLAQAGGLKTGGIKRTAFADVSNTTRGFGLVKDDSALSHKPSVNVLKERTDSNKNAIALQRPAQRPLSVSGIKEFLGIGTTQSTSVRQAVPAISHQNSESDASKAMLISVSAIPKETQHPLPELPNANDRQPANDQQPLGTQAAPKKKASLQIARDVPHTQKTASDPVAWIPGIEQPLVYTYDTRQAAPQLPSLPTISSLNLDEPKLATASETHQDVAYLPLPKPTAIRPINRQPLSSISEKQVTQPQPMAADARYEERWEEGPYVPYQEGDYTTARSFKSRGDLTTDPTTTILAPQLTAGAARELVAARQFVEESPEAAELEEDEAWDTSMVAEYGDDIFRYMRTLEEQMRPNPCYMDDQTEVQWSMRSVLMDWLVQVHHRFALLPETLFLCVNFIDRFLSCKVVSLGKLQLVGATAIFVAAKYEEINCPSVQEIVYMVDGGYTIDEILKAERFMLSMLQFELGWPGPMSFLRRISKGDDYDLETRTLAKYFLEITIMDERFVGCIPSFTAAGGHCLARLMLKKGYWSQKHVHYSGYTYSQLRPLLHTMLSCCDDAQKHHGAVFDKYSDKRFKRASYFVQAEVDRGFTLPALTRTLSIGCWESSPHSILG